MSDPARQLLDWYDRHARILPWRVAPRDLAAGARPDPYRVWLSEVMLQQTTVAAVKPYFDKFTARWPTVRDLAAASQDEVMQYWAGLGYYSRASNLKRCADVVTGEHGGVFPDTRERLQALPGIGAYTSAAIAAIAFGHAEAVVDGNVERVMTRFHAIDTPLPAAKADIHKHLEQIVPEDRPGDFAQAMMDLGATVCTPKRPSCLPCPWRDTCRGLATGDPERFPVKPPKADKPQRVGAAFVARRADGAVLLEKRAGKGLLAGMAQVPTTGWTARHDGETGADAAPFAADWRNAGSIDHVFTHFRLRLTVWTAQTAIEPGANQWWSTSQALDGEALPTVMRKVISAAQPDAFRRKAS